MRSKYTFKVQHPKLINFYKIAEDLSYKNPMAITIVADKIFVTFSPELYFVHGLKKKASEKPLSEKLESIGVYQQGTTFSVDSMKQVEKFKELVRKIRIKKWPKNVEFKGVVNVSVPDFGA